MTIACVLLASLAQASADEDDVQRLYAVATEQFESGDYAAAAATYKACYALSERPNLLFNIALSHHRAGQILEAETFYRRYLEASPDGQAAAEAARYLQEIEAALAKREEAEGEPGGDAESPAEPSEATPPPTTAVPSPATDSSPWYTDWLGAVLATGAVATGVASGLVYRSTRREATQARRATIYDDYADRAKSVERKELVAAGLAGAAGLLAAGAIWRYASGDDERSRQGAALVPARGGASLSWSF